MNNSGAHEQTSIWARTLAYRKDDPAEEARSRLRNAYESLRRNVSHLVAQITKELPQLTLHDIRHLDALWTTADLIAGPQYPITPSEAFVFGGAVLLHDAGHALASVKGGFAGLTEMPEWRDATVGILEGARYSPITPTTIKNPPREFLDDIIFSTLRTLHGNIAESLAYLELENENTNSRLSLFEDGSLRIHYGALVGKIASSHNWEIEDLPLRLQSRVGAVSGMPGDWTIDPVKIACLLRCADAAQIDQQRSPDFLFALLKLRGLSKNHWLAQNKLAQPIRDPDDLHALLYSSTNPYSENQTDAWWVAFDLVTIINKELGTCNALLRSTQRPEFAITRVRDAEIPVRLAKHITTSGWTPVQAEVRISNSVGVAGMLGGSVLYGESPFVAIRELIQNAVDSIKARRYFEGVSQQEGLILVRIREIATDGKKQLWLDVQDNGIGMAPHILVGPLIDFGTSLWRNRILESEFPGLRSSKFRSIGRFGIGFYSTFMIADAVSVASKRFDQGISQGKTLFFGNGLASSPILLDKLPANFPSNSQTVVSLRLKPEIAKILTSEKFYLNFKDESTSSAWMEPGTLEENVGRICPSLDCDVFFQTENQAPVKVHDRYWYKENGEQWLQKLFFPKEKFNRKNRSIVSEAAGRLSLIYDGDDVVGRAAVSTVPVKFTELQRKGFGKIREEEFISGYATFGGLTGENTKFPTGTNAFFGLIDGRPNHAARFSPPLLLQWNLTEIFRSPEQRENWLNDQLDMLAKKTLSSDQVSEYKENFARFGRVLPKYYAMRLFERGEKYEKLEDIPIRPIGELGEGEENQIQIHVPTMKGKRGVEPQALYYIDKRELKVISLVLDTLGIECFYFPSTVSASQVSLPKDLSKHDEFSGILASLLTSLKGKGFQLEVSALAIPKMHGLDKTSSQILERALSGIIKIEGKRSQIT
jgi:hypothetical protein